MPLAQRRKDLGIFNLYVLPHVKSWTVQSGTYNGWQYLILPGDAMGEITCFDRIQPQNYKFSSCVKNKATGDSKRKLMAAWECVCTRDGLG